MAYKIFGLENRKDNEPVVVFEAGLGSGGGGYGGLLPFVQKNLQVLFMIETELQTLKSILP
ncbi:hypothetical protein [Chryseobacterium wanjuense]